MDGYFPMGDPQMMDMGMMMHQMASMGPAMGGMPPMGGMGMPGMGMPGMGPGMPGMHMGPMGMPGMPMPGMGMGMPMPGMPMPGRGMPGMGMGMPPWDGTAHGMGGHGSMGGHVPSTAPPPVPQSVWEGKEKNAGGKGAKQAKVTQPAKAPAAPAPAAAAEACEGGELANQTDSSPEPSPTVKEHVNPYGSYAKDLVARLEAGLPEFPAVLEERRQRVETLTYAVEGLQSHVAEATAQRADAGRLLEEGLREVRSALARRAAEKKKTRSEGEGGDTAEACDVLYRVNPVVTATGGITTMEDMDTEESDALRELFQADLDCVLSAMVQESLPHEEAVSPGECVLGEPTDQEVFQVSEGMPLDWMRAGKKQGQPQAEDAPPGAADHVRYDPRQDQLPPKRLSKRDKGKVLGKLRAMWTAEMNGLC